MGSFKANRPEPRTLAELCALWSAYTAPFVSARTAEVESGYLTAAVLPYLGDLPLAEVTTRHLDALYGELLSVGARRGPWAPASVRRLHGILRRVFRQAHRWGLVGFDPAALASPPRRASPARRLLSAADIRRLLSKSEVTAPWLSLLCRLAVVSGARRGELLALRFSDFDFDHDTMTIARGIVLAQGRIIEQPTKSGIPRSLGIDQVTLRLVAESQPPTASAGEVPSEDGRLGWVFSRQGDGRLPLRPDSVSRAFRRLAGECGLSGARFHDLRHYAASSLLAQGVGVATVAHRLGHRHPSTTLDIYAHLVPEADRQAASVLAATLAEPEAVRSAR